MNTYTLDAYKGWSEDRMKERLRALCRANLNKDILICQLVEFGSVDAMPKVFGDEVRRIVKEYCEDEPDNGELPK